VWRSAISLAAATWRHAWDRLFPFFAFVPEICSVIDTTNAIGSLTSQLRKITKTQGHFPSGDAFSKLPRLAMLSITADWMQSVGQWLVAPTVRLRRRAGQLPMPRKWDVSPSRDLQPGRRAHLPAPRL
jgi:transposase-like protein